MYVNSVATRLCVCMCMCARACVCVRVCVCVCVRVWLKPDVLLQLSCLKLIEFPNLAELCQLTRLQELSVSLVSRAEGDGPSQAAEIVLSWNGNGRHSH